MTVKLDNNANSKEESPGNNNNELSKDEYASLEESDADVSLKIGVYRLRWMILFIACSSMFLRGFNQSCYGPINDIFDKYLHIAPWQTDWFILTQSVVFLSMSMPLSWITSRLGFRNSYILMTSTLSIGFILTTIGVYYRAGYPLDIVGQVSMGFSNIISWSIPPPTAAIWFPSNEVATAVALQVVGRGVGESLGSILTPIIVNMKQGMSVVGNHFVLMFLGMSIIAVSLLILTLIFVKDEPPLPPSESRAQAILNRKGNMQKESFIDALKQYKTTIKELFLNPHFVVVWFVFSVANPVLRNDNMLLTSILHSTFHHEHKLDVKGGFVLMGSWIGYTVGGFIAGPIITKTKSYKAVVLFSVGFECIACIVVLIGVSMELINWIFAGVLSIGLFQGMANTALFELIREVTYPKPAMLVTMVSLIGLGTFRLAYPLVGRILLSNSMATAATAFPVGLLLIANIMLIIMKPTYNRLNAECGEKQPLLTTK